MTEIIDWTKLSPEEKKVELFRKQKKLLDTFLEKEDNIEAIPDRVFSAFRRVSGKEPNYRKRSAAKCDLTYALLRAIWNVIE